MAKAAFQELFHPSVKTDGNENEKVLFIAVPFKGREESSGLVGFSRNQIDMFKSDFPDIKSRKSFKSYKSC